MLTGAGGRVRPRFVWSDWKPLLKQAAPVALSLVVNTTYVRALIIICSLVATAEETGLFATSYRVSEILLGVPQLMLGAAFPILVHAHGADTDRLRYALQRMGEASLLVGLGLGLGIAVGAAPIVQVLGGSEFAAATDVLRIQSVAIAGAFMTQLGTFALIAVERQRALMLVNLFALVSVLVLGFTLIPLREATGAAIAASVGEVALAIASIGILARLRPELAARPALRAEAAAGGRPRRARLPAARPGHRRGGRRGRRLRRRRAAAARASRRSWSRRSCGAGGRLRPTRPASLPGHERGRRRRHLQEAASCSPTASTTSRRRGRAAAIA